MHTAPVSEVSVKTGKTCFGLLIAPISLHVVSQKIMCYCGNVKTKYFSVLKSFLFLFVWVFAIHKYCNIYGDGLFPWKPLSCRTNKQFSRVVGWFFSLFFPLSNSNLHLCKAEKKSLSNEIMLTSAWNKQEENGNWLTDGTRQPLSAQVSKGLLFLGCCISKAIKLRNSTDFPHS